MDYVIESIFGFRAALQAAQDEDYVKAFYGEAAYNAILAGERYRRLCYEAKLSGQLLDDVSGQLKEVP